MNVKLILKQVSRDFKRIKCYGWNDSIITNSKRSFINSSFEWGTKIDGEIPKNKDFEVNKKHMEEIISDFRITMKKSMDGGGEKAKLRHKSRGKLLARERIDSLIDLGSPFLEFSVLAGHDMYNNDKVPCGGIVTGIGKVNGIYCMIVANDATVKGGVNNYN